MGFFVCYSSCCNLFHGETVDRQRRKHVITIIQLLLLLGKSVLLPTSELAVFRKEFVLPRFAQG